MDLGRQSDQGFRSTQSIFFDKCNLFEKVKQNLPGCFQYIFHYLVISSGIILKYTLNKQFNIHGKLCFITSRLINELDNCRQTHLLPID